MSRVVQELLKFSEAYFDKTIHSFVRQRSEAFWAGVRSGAAWICGTRRLGKASGGGVPPARLGKSQRKQKGALPQRCGKAPFTYCGMQLRKTPREICGQAVPAHGKRGGLL